MDGTQTADRKEHKARVVGLFQKKVSRVKPSAWKPNPYSLAPTTLHMASSYGRNKSIALANCLLIISAWTRLRGAIDHWNGLLGLWIDCMVKNESPDCIKHLQPMCK